MVLGSMRVRCPCSRNRICERFKDLVIRVSKPGIGFPGDFDSKVIPALQIIELFLCEGREVRGDFVRVLVWHDTDGQRGFRFAGDSRCSRFAGPGDFDGVDC